MKYLSLFHKFFVIELINIISVDLISFKHRQMVTVRRSFSVPCFSPSAVRQFCSTNQHWRGVRAVCGHCLTGGRWDNYGHVPTVRYSVLFLLACNIKLNLLLYWMSVWFASSQRESHSYIFFLSACWPVKQWKTIVVTFNWINFCCKKKDIVP